jgi:hypothetical protein
MLLSDKIIEIILDGEKKGKTTARLAKDIAKHVYDVVQVRTDLELETLVNVSLAIDFDGDLRTLDRYRKAITQTRTRILEWKRSECARMEEGIQELR